MEKKIEKPLEHILKIASEHDRDLLKEVNFLYGIVGFGLGYFTADSGDFEEGYASFQSIGGSINDIMKLLQDHPKRGNNSKVQVTEILVQLYRSSFKIIDRKKSLRVFEDDDARDKFAEQLGIPPHSLDMIAGRLESVDPYKIFLRIKKEIILPSKKRDEQLIADYVGNLENTFYSPKRSVGLAEEIYSAILLAKPLTIDDLVQKDLTTEEISEAQSKGYLLRRFMEEPKQYGVKILKSICLRPIKDLNTDQFYENIIERWRNYLSERDLSSATAMAAAVSSIAACTKLVIKYKKLVSLMDGTLTLAEQENDVIRGMSVMKDLANMVASNRNENVSNEYATRVAFRHNNLRLKVPCARTIWG